MVLIGVMCIGISFLLAEIFRKQRFVQVPSPDYFDDYENFEDFDFENDKPQRG